jgi:hypothetical protein
MRFSPTKGTRSARVASAIGPSLEQSVSDFEGYSGAAKIRKPSVGLRIDQGCAIGSFAGDFVMIEDDDVSSALTNHRHFARRVGAAIHRHEEIGRVLLKTAFDS